MREAIERLLSQAGWRPGRSQDVAPLLSLLESRGYNTRKRQEQFLREFDGITIEFIRNDRKDSISFDAKRASAQADPEWIAYYESRTKTPLAPIGFANHEHLILMQSSEGGFYGAFDDFLYSLGSDAEEMIENIVNQHREPLI